MWWQSEQLPWWSSGYDACLECKRPGFNSPLRHWIFQSVRTHCYSNFTSNYVWCYSCSEGTTRKAITRKFFQQQEQVASNKLQCTTSGSSEYSNNDAETNQKRQGSWLSSSGLKLPHQMRRQTDQGWKVRLNAKDFQDYHTLSKRTITALPLPPCLTLSFTGTLSHNIKWQPLKVEEDWRPTRPQCTYCKWTFQWVLRINGK